MILMVRMGWSCGTRSSRSTNANIVACGSCLPRMRRPPPLRCGRILSHQIAFPQPANVSLPERRHTLNHRATLVLGVRPGPARRPAHCLFRRFGAEHVCRQRLVGADRKATAPSPSESVLERRIRRRPVPSASVIMSFQVRTAASDTLSMPSRIGLINAMSRFPLHLAVSRLSNLPPRPRRGLQAVDCMSSSASAASAFACF